MKALRVGVVGVGHIGSNHARLYAELPSVEFSAIYDVDAARATAIGKKYGVTPAKSLEEFAEMIDAASIATPTSTHHRVAHPLLTRGKHLLIEKPITDDTKDASELAELAARNQLVLQVGHVERFNPVLSALEERLTHPRFIEAHRLSPYPNRSTDIGVVLDLMIHDLEIILHLVRSPVQTIDAVGVPVLSRGEDIANARVRFENGCVANITATTGGTFSTMVPEAMMAAYLDDGPDLPDEPSGRPKRTFSVTLAAKITGSCGTRAAAGVATSGAGGSPPRESWPRLVAAFLSGAFKLPPKLHAGVFSES
jgi:predicted dehydrogenase